MSSAFDELLELAGKLGVTVRHAHLGGAGGGLARVKGAALLFIDLDADGLDQLEQTARAMASLPNTDALYVRPDVRQLLENYGRAGR